MSEELVKQHATFPRSRNESQHNTFERLTCVLCNIELDVSKTEHKCGLRDERFNQTQANILIGNRR